MRPPKISHTTGLLLIGVFASMLSPFASIAHAATESVVYSFQNNGKDGVAPEASLLDVNGILYGTTDAGGTGRCGNGCGTIFSVDEATGSETILHSFSGVQRQPPFTGSMIKAEGKLFGTTYRGGHRDGGMVFSFNPKSGAFKERYYFCNLYDCSDGENPTTDLLKHHGILYGTTSSGGGTQVCPSGCGTVFSFDPNTGAETALYSFCSLQNCADGDDPQAGLIDVKGMLYGTTLLNGSGANCGFGDTCGTVFSLDPVTGVESVLHSFCSQQGCTDGQAPRSDLINLKQVLYGTTQSGGTYNLGTVFSIDLSTGTETVLHSFGGRHDGSYPAGGLVHFKGRLFGITAFGGRGTCACGTVYSINLTTGAERVVYSFCSQTGCADGALPQGTLLNVNDTFYGVTSEGGSGTCRSTYGGCGTVFSVTP